MEITWNPIDRHWDICPLHPQYQCEIPYPVPPVIEWGPLDGEEEEPQTTEELTMQQAMSDTTKDSEESEHSGHSPMPQTHASTDPIITDLTIAAESIHIHEPMATFTVQMAQETITLPPINLATRHCFTDDEAAIHQAIAPDIGDPPSAERPMRNLCRGDTPDDNDDDDNFGGRGRGPLSRSDWFGTHGSLSLGLPSSLHVIFPLHNHALYYKACMTHDAPHVASSLSLTRPPDS